MHEGFKLLMAQVYFLVSFSSSAFFTSLGMSEKKEKFLPIHDSTFSRHVQALYKMYLSSKFPLFSATILFAWRIKFSQMNKS